MDQTDDLASLFEAVLTSRQARASRACLVARWRRHDAPSGGGRRL